MLDYMKEYGNLLNFLGVKRIFLEEFWVLDVDIVILVVLENFIIKEVVEFIKVKLVCEVVNGLIILEVDEVFVERGIVFILDILINVGGVIVFYFEWV